MPVATMPVPLSVLVAWVLFTPATQAQLDLANNILTSASTPQIGKTLAVATLLAAAHTCE